MPKEGKVCIGFSNPYIGIYSENGGNPTYSNGRRLARGVSISIDPEVADDNPFYADNVLAETEAGVFTGGTAELTVDGLHQEAERLIMGLPEPEAFGYRENKTVNMLKYGDNISIPYVGIGFIAKYKSGGVVTYVPVILRKARFQTPGSDHATREESDEYQTQSLTATLARDDSPNHEWKWIAEDQPTEEEADAILRAVLGVEEAGA